VTPLVVAGIGEVLWDIYPDGAHFGGAPANFASHAANLGAESWMVSSVGTDALGERALRVLADHHVMSDLVPRDAKHPTGRVVVTLGDAGVPRYEIALDSAWDHLEWSGELAAFSERCDAVCFGSLAQRSAESRSTIRRFVGALRSDALRVFDVNLRQQYYDREIIEASLQLASAVKLNDEELTAIADLLRIDGQAPRNLMRELMTRYRLRLGALTRGPNGALLLDERDEDDSPAPPTIVVDTVGAGDAFTAVMVVDFLRGVPLGEINRHANAVASFVCSQAGATPSIPEALPSCEGSSRT
jgi:fructokinase